MPEWLSCFYQQTIVGSFPTIPLVTNLFSTHTGISLFSFNYLPSNLLPKHTLSKFHLCLYWLMVLTQGPIEEDKSTPGANILEHQDGGNRREA